jgi:predicted nucleic acid-binding protein
MIAVDSSVLIDLLWDSPSAQSAEVAIRESLSIGPVVICDVALSEISAALKDGSECLAALEELGIRFDAIEPRSAIRAGEMQRRYRQRGGKRERTVPDFLVGAHALLQCQGLITRDRDFFHDYFKGLRVIVPVETT